MHSIIGRRRGRLAIAAIAIFGVAGGIAFASIPGADGVIHGCYRSAAGDVQGQLRVVEDPASCRSNETPIQWNEQGVAGPAGPAGADGADGEDGADGQDGADGSSPTVAQLAPGDANCADGGAAITDAAGTTAYVCNGGQGPAGQDGADGAPFSGTFTSPNGQFSISVTDTGVTVASPDSAISVTGSAIRVESMGLDPIEISAANRIDVDSGAAFELQAGGTASLQSAAGFAVRGAAVSINGVGCQPAARAGDVVSGTHIVTGSTTVCIG
ncbi:MAG TPA: hypothetical protein VML35_04120 [Gaiellaceae bacterium]|nr:hypothetical protein [Gaiellaceae bacterium]